MRNGRASVKRPAGKQYTFLGGPAAGPARSQLLALADVDNIARTGLADGRGVGRVCGLLVHVGVGAILLGYRHAIRIGALAVLDDMGLVVAKPRILRNFRPILPERAVHSA